MSEPISMFFICPSMTVLGSIVSMTMLLFFIAGFEIAGILGMACISC